MKRLRFYQGYHSDAFDHCFAHAWKQKELLIVVPPVELDPSWRRTLDKLPDLPDDPALGVLTTGTTSSAQKLVLFSRANIAASQDAILALFDTHRIDSIFCYPQPYHVFGLLLGYVMATRRDLRFLRPEGAYDRKAHQAWLEATGPSLLTLATPSHMHDLCAWLQTNGKKPPPSYSCILGGAKVSRQTWINARDVAMITSPSIGYGCTEASPGICHLPPGIEPLCDGDIGWTLAGVNLAVGATSLSMRGPSVCLATIEGDVISSPQELIVNDHLMPLPEGRFAFLGRTDLVLNRGGEKFSLEAIESLLKHQYDIEVLCTALPDPRLGSELGILAVTTNPVDKAAILSTLQGAYKRNFSGAKLRFVERLPFDRNAKLDRKRAREILETHR